MTVLALEFYREATLTYGLAATECTCSSAEFGGHTFAKGRKKSTAPEYVDMFILWAETAFEPLKEDEKAVLAPKTLVPLYRHLQVVLKHTLDKHAGVLRAKGLLEQTQGLQTRVRQAVETFSDVLSSASAKKKT